MLFPRYLWPALDTLFQHRLRSLLTVLGIAIGVTATVMMMALGRGVQGTIEQQFVQAGVTQLLVKGRPPPDASNTLASRHDQYELRWSDYQALTAPGSIPGLQAVVPVVRTQTAVRVQGHELWVDLLGVTPDYLTTSGHALAGGDFLDAEDSQGQRLVAVLGDGVVRHLFGSDAYPLHLWITLYGRKVQIIGVLAPRGTAEDYQILMPILTMQKRLLGMVTVSGEALVDEIHVRVASAVQVEEATRTIESLLRRQRRIGPLEHHDFAVTAADAEREALTEITDTMTLFLAAIAAISLLVGGVGVTNIMLVSLGERTREIGIRYSVGARVRDIAFMFLLESVLLCSLGGLLGVTICVYALVFLRGLWDPAPVLALDMVVQALVISIAVGLLAGVYPALRARHVTPVEALHSL